jgi:hypothetical protein
MVEKVSAQQPVISIRISEVLRARLERLKELIFFKSGENVSTSEAAKQLLESARDDRLELVNLLHEPTDSLINIRRKATARLVLSQAEWALVAHYCQLGMETYANTAQTEISYDSLTAILEAFLAVYGLVRRQKRTPRDAYFTANLLPDKQTANKDAHEIGIDDVRRVVGRTIQMLKGPVDDRHRPILIARNLYVLLDEEKFSNIERLNEALWPHWTALWRVCARGHYFEHGKPLRDFASEAAEFGALNPPLPSFQEGEYRLELERSEGNSFSLCLCLPGRLSPLYPVSDYPRISELKTILEQLDTRRQLIFWEGRYFLAHTWCDEAEKIGVMFRARENGIAFAFRAEDWRAIRSLFRRAWQAPEVRRLWDAQADQYGEL